MLPRRHLALMGFVWAVCFCVPPSHRTADGSAGDRGQTEQNARSPASRMWPVDIPVHLSSSFGEFRDGHLHAGLDIRSFGREGIPCRSVGSGYVARLRASPSGYGKAVYIKLDRGETAVYAHLSEFAPEIDSVVYAAQVESDRYTVDITLEPGRFPVEEGEIIAYTGRTGATAPHLHFEVRAADESPVNPLDQGWALHDAVPPTIRRLECLPLAPDARVNGMCAPDVVELRALDARTFAASETLAVIGSVGFGAQVLDHAGTTSGDLAPYRVEFEVDGKRVSTIEMKSFTYDQTREVELAYDISRARSQAQHYLLLFRREGETLAHREFVDDGIVHAATLVPGMKRDPNVHTAVLRAIDYSGNVSTASLFFVDSAVAGYDSTPRGGTSPTRRTTGRGELPGFYFFEDMMSVHGWTGEDADSVVSSAPGARKRIPNGGDSSGFVLSFDDIGETGRTFSVRIGGKTTEVHVVGARRDGVLRRDFVDVGAGLTVSKGCLFSDALLYLAPWERDPSRTLAEGAGLSALTRGVRFGPASAVIKSPVEIRFAAPDPRMTNAAVFHFDERKAAWSLRTSSVRGDSVCALVREPGVYCVLADSLAPTIGAPHVASRRSYATRSVFQELVVHVVDRGSGVDADKTEVYLDGKKQIARWDGFSEKLFVILRDKNIPGVHDLSIAAVDRLANSTRLVTQLQIPPPVTQGGTKGGH